MAKNIGAIIFIIGIVLALLIAIFGSMFLPTWAGLILALLGAVVGIMNVGASERQLFLVAAVAFLLSFQALASIANTLLFGWDAVQTFFQLMVVFFAPATAIVAIKALLQLAKD